MADNKPTSSPGSSDSSTPSTTTTPATVTVQNANVLSKYQRIIHGVPSIYDCMQHAPSHYKGESLFWYVVGKLKIDIGEKRYVCLVCLQKWMDNGQKGKAPTSFTCTPKAGKFNDDLTGPRDHLKLKAKTCSYHSAFLDLITKKKPEGQIYFNISGGVGDTLSTTVSCDTIIAWKFSLTSDHADVSFSFFFLFFLFFLFLSRRNHL